MAALREFFGSRFRHLLDGIRESGIMESPEDFDSAITFENGLFISWPEGTQQ